MLRSPPSILALSALLLAAPASHAQFPPDPCAPWVDPGGASADRLGAALATAGDVDADGELDLIAGAPGAAANKGSIRVLSTATGAVLFVRSGTVSGEQYGFAVAGGLDANSDGFADVLVSAPGMLRAEVLAGPVGAPLYALNGTSGTYGNAVAVVGDVDGDGVRDVAVGSPTSPLPGPSAGRYDVYRGTSGASLFGGTGAAGDLLGSAIASAGDVDGDGIEDLAVGAPKTPSAAVKIGYVRIVSGATHATLATRAGTGDLDRFGAALAGAGDLDLDGVPDLLAGAPGATGASGATGLARVLSGSSGAALATWFGHSAGDQFGAAVAAGRDVNGDGSPDALIGAPLDDNEGVDSGSITVFSGVDASALAARSGTGASDRFGSAVAFAGSAGADHYEDFAAGAPYANANGADSGAVSLFLGRCPNLPRFDLAAGAVGGAASFTLSVRDAAPHGIALALASPLLVPPIAVPGVAGALMLDPSFLLTLAALPLDAAGSLSLSVPYPSGAPGFTAFLQTAVLTPGGGVSLTDNTSATSGTCTCPSGESVEGIAAYTDYLEEWEISVSGATTCEVIVPFQTLWVGAVFLDQGVPTTLLDSFAYFSGTLTMSGNKKLELGDSIEFRCYYAQPSSPTEAYLCVLDTLGC